jgi:hypothetical protein
MGGAMKIWVAVVLASALCFLPPAAHGQQCYTPVKSWQGSYSLNAITTLGAACNLSGLSGTCDISQSITANISMTLNSVDCSGIVSWMGTDVVTNASLNDAGTT